MSYNLWQSRYREEQSTSNKLLENKYLDEDTSVFTSSFQELVLTLVLAVRGFLEL